MNYTVVKIFRVIVFVLVISGCALLPMTTPQTHTSVESASAGSTTGDTTGSAGAGAMQAGNSGTGGRDECAQTVVPGTKYYLTSEGSDQKMERVRVGATGYGAPPKNYYPEGQRRLMTLRASKVDAYRALAEIVGGLHVWGGSAIADMVLERDRYRAFVDSYVRGARVVSVAAQEDGTYKTVLEMEVDQRFLFQVMAFIDPDKNQHCFDADKRQFSYYGFDRVSPSFYYSE